MATQYYTASSIDGFIADPEATLSWLLSRHTDREGPMGYERFFADVGALAMGSTTYRWVLDHEGRWPYTLPTWVFTHRDDLPRAAGNVQLVRGSVAEHHAAMTAAAAGRHVWVVGGGDLAGQFADAGLLDELWVSFAPVTLGAGAPLLPRRLELSLEEVARNGEFACVRYRVLGPPVAEA
jgi:dihydrofolate reductase